MRLVAPPTVNTALYEEHAAESARWLVSLLAWITGALDYYAPLIERITFLREAAAIGRAKAARSLRRVVSQLRIVVTTLAFARMRVQRGRGDTIRPGHARRTARRLREWQFYRLATGGLFTGIHEGSLRQRATRLGALLANLEPLIARALKRLNAMWRYVRRATYALIITHDAAPRSATPRIAHADTS